MIKSFGSDIAGLKSFGADVQRVYSNGALAWEKQAEPIKSWALVSSGTAYINSGQPPSYYTRIETKYQYSGKTIVDTGFGFLFGARQSASANIFCFLQYGATAGTPNQAFPGFSNNNTLVVIADPLQRHTMAMGSGGCYLDGNLIKTFTNAPVFSYAQPMYILALNQGGTPEGRRAIAEMEYFKIYENNVLVRDFIPVPQGDTTYSATPAPSNCMWDAVTKQYFGSIGAGQFGIVEVTGTTPLMMSALSMLDIGVSDGEIATEQDLKDTLEYLGVAL